MGGVTRGCGHRGWIGGWNTHLEWPRHHGTSFSFFLGLIARSHTYSQRASIKLGVVEVAHGTLGSLCVHVLTKTITLRLPGLSVIHQPEGGGAGWLVYGTRIMIGSG